MTDANSRLKLQSTGRGRTVAILLLICSGIAGVQFLLAGLVAYGWHVPFTDAIYAMLTLFGIVPFTAALVWRWHGYVVRGQRVADAGREPRRKLFAWVAAISLIAGVVLAEVVRREAEIAPVHSRIQQLIALRQPTLNRTQNLLDHQRALLGIVPPDLVGAQHVGQLIQQEQGESKGLGDLIDSGIAEERQLAYRLLPEWTEIQQSLKDLRNRLAMLPSQPWNVLATKYTLQLYISVFAIVNGLISLLIAVGRRQIRENGIWQGGVLIRWKLIGPYSWENDTLVALIGRTQSSISLPIAREDKLAVEDLLALNLAANQ